MKILPTPVEEFVNRTDRNRSLAFGISGAVLAFWSLYRVFWALYVSVTFSGIGGWSPVSLVVPIVLWGAIGVVSAVAAFAFLTRYAKQT